MPDKLYSLLVVDKGGGLPFKSATTLCRIQRWPLRQCCLLYLPLLLILVVFTVKTRVKPNENAVVQFSNYLELNEVLNQDEEHFKAEIASEASTQQERRQKRIKDYCQSKLSMDDDGKTINYVRKQVVKSLHKSKISTIFTTKDDINFVGDKNSQWAYCHVPKAASTTWMLALAQINQVENFTQLMNEGLLHGHMMHEFGIPETRLNKEAFTFTFLRHPFERLVSAYHEKFVIRQEMNFIQPVIDWEAGLSGRLVAWFDSDIKRKKDFNLNFKKFVHFVIHELETNIPSYGSLHWWPFSRLCGLCHIKYDFIGKVETLQSDVEALAPQIRGFQPSQRQLFSVKFNKNRKEETSKAYFSQLDSPLIMQLYSLFEDDFQLGNYDYPSDYLNLHK